MSKFIDSLFITINLYINQPIKSLTNNTTYDMYYSEITELRRFVTKITKGKTMFRKLITTIVCLTSLTFATMADDTSSNDYGWVISLGGTGSTVTVEDHDTTVGADLSVGYTGKLLLPLEGGIRQGFSYDSSAVFSTKAYADFTLFSFANKAFDVFVGGNVGIAYGDIQSAWTAAPEGGLRWWLKEDVAVLFRAEAPFQLDSGARFTESVRYFLGFQVKF